MLSGDCGQNLRGLRSDRVIGIGRGENYLAVRIDDERGRYGKFPTPITIEPEEIDVECLQVQLSEVIGQTERETVVPRDT